VSGQVSDAACGLWMVERFLLPQEHAVMRERTGYTNEALVGLSAPPKGDGARRWGGGTHEGPGQSSKDFMSSP